LEGVCEQVAHVVVVDLEHGHPHAARKRVAVRRVRLRVQRQERKDLVDGAVAEPVSLRVRRAAAPVHGVGFSAGAGVGAKHTHHPQTKNVTRSWRMATKCVTPILFSPRPKGALTCPFGRTP
jgi:hypothetical protein